MKVSHNRHLIHWTVVYHLRKQISSCTENISSIHGEGGYATVAYPVTGFVLITGCTAVKSSPTFSGAPRASANNVNPLRLAAALKSGCAWVAVRLSRNTWYGLEILSKTLRCVNIYVTVEHGHLKSVDVPHIRCCREPVILVNVPSPRITKTHLAHKVSPPVSGSSVILRIA